MANIGLNRHVAPLGLCLVHDAIFSINISLLMELKTKYQSDFFKFSKKLNCYEKDTTKKCGFNVSEFPSTITLQPN